MPRLGVIGTLVWDRIWHPAGAGEPVEQWGGIAYSLSSLSAAAPEDWVVVPMIKVGEDLVDTAHEFLSNIPAIALGEGFRSVAEPTNRVELTYTDAARRGERLTGGVPAWEWDELEPLIQDIDALFINFISGFEVDLETAQRLRERFEGPIYADLHSLFLGCPGAGIRQPRVLPRWREWVACFDAIQLNQAEMELLADGKSVEDFATELLGHGPGITAVTVGEGGALITGRTGRLWQPASRERLSIHVPLAGESLPGDPTGCGDVWGGAFYLSLLAGSSPQHAAGLANSFASQKIMTPQIERLHESLRGLLPTIGNV
ncbi:hypothetical protein BH23GEM6_BH23GEM6_10050 [soil metagenome]